MDRRINPPKRVTPTWGPSPPCKKGLSANIVNILHSKDTITFKLKCTSHKGMYGLHSDSIMDIMKIT